MLCNYVSMLNQEFVGEMKETLIARKNQLEQELASLTAGDNPRAVGEVTVQWKEYGSSEDENASETEEFSTNLSLEKNLENSLKEVDEALERIEDGSYGICQNCKKPIGEPRLAARQESVLCVQCSELLG